MISPPIFILLVYLQTFYFVWIIGQNLFLLRMFLIIVSIVIYLTLIGNIFIFIGMHKNIFKLFLTNFPLASSSTREM
ncbi:hypothetical protein VNO80_09094 [Phaseolus coccineus]|uniref:Uncharacterized protein n=1 Tax=Phaseolus coccineus TaxID=3886 RepID=A0AAN9R968_PHACN